jgi:aminoglycoside phosphotransferase
MTAEHTDMPSNEPDIEPITRHLIVLFAKARDQKYIRRLWKPSPGLMTVFNFCIKVAPMASLSEANAMRFVAQHTSVPVPKVYCAFVHKASTCLVMSKIKGQMAWHGWQSGTEQSKANMPNQLHRMVTELRSVPPPKGASVGSVDRGPFYDCRLPSKLLWGPYDTVRGFHAALANDTDFDTNYANLPDDVSRLFDFYRHAGDQLVLTHGDLSSLNILVEADKVVSIVDWETAGWFPPYWEYTCAKNVNPQNTFWADEVDAFLEPMPHELGMEKIRQRYFGAF